jgi:hypothetical protein
MPSVNWCTPSSVNAFVAVHSSRNGSSDAGTDRGRRCSFSNATQRRSSFVVGYKRITVRELGIQNDVIDKRIAHSSVVDRQRAAQSDLFGRFRHERYGKRRVWPNFDPRNTLPPAQCGDQPQPPYETTAATIPHALLPILRMAAHERLDVWGLGFERFFLIGGDLTLCPHEGMQSKHSARSGVARQISAPTGARPTRARRPPTLRPTVERPVDVSSYSPKRRTPAPTQAASTPSTAS